MTDSPTVEDPTMSDRCECCGAIRPRREVFSLREIVLNTICAVALLASVAPIIYLADHWVESQTIHLFEHRIWHEPLDDWSLD
jgi:hypothetical protein